MCHTQVLDPGVLDDVPVAPQPVRQSGTVPGADPRPGTGASVSSPRDQMDVCTVSPADL